MHLLFDKEINKRFLCEYKIQFRQRVTLEKWSIIAKNEFRIADYSTELEIDRIDLIKYIQWSKI